MKTEFPGWKFVSATVSGTLDTSIVEKADHVFFFSDTISHSTYYMGRSFSKEFLLKLINQNRDVQMDENKMMKRLKAFKGSDIVEYNGYIISDYVKVLNTSRRKILNNDLEDIE